MSSDPAEPAAVRFRELGRQWFALTGAMVAWGIGFLLHYGLSWSACVGGWADLNLLGVKLVHILLVLTTLLTLGLAAAAVSASWRIWRSSAGSDDHDAVDQDAAPDPATRSRFMALAGLLLGAFFLYAIIVQALPILIMPVCA